MRAGRKLVLAGALSGLSACGGIASAVDPAGPQAARISALTWSMVGLGGIVWLVVVGFTGYALWRGRRRIEDEAAPEAEERMTRWVVGAVGASSLVLLTLLAANLFTGRALAHFADADAVTIRVTARQWWWAVEYMDPVPSRRVVTANEIHIPVGRPVRLLLESRDVIHSFWVPNLHGKLDAIPGYSNTTYFQADRPGVYHGRCAEFCGHQHAKMALLVVAHEPGEFTQWYERELRPAQPPADSLRLAGQEVFLSGSCVLCHTIRGTPAASRLGPDLTHLGSRRTLAAGSIPNTRGHLGGWIVDPQGIKPGTQMPGNPLPSEDLQALLVYLEGLR